MKRFLGFLIVLIVLVFIANRFVPVFPWLRSFVAGPSGTQHSSKTCRIKGNISWSGEHIYHVPGQPYYDATRIDTAMGERWFCSEAQARAAGWRKANGY